MTRPRVCLTMIVKNEARIIGRCLRSVRRLIDHWIIVDTGSTDETEAEVLRAMHGVPGEFHKRPWHGFGPAKTEALELARQLTNSEGYALVVDADEILEGELPSDLRHDSYGIWMQINNVRFKNVRLFRLDKNWKYVGVLHEYPASDDAKTESMVDITITTPRDGARSNNPNKYQDDAAALEAEIARVGPEPRYVFYLAQSYRDSGNDAQAVENYLKRAAMSNGFYEEVYVSLLEAARAYDRLGQKQLADVTYLRAHHAWPDRAEALRALAHRTAQRREASEAKQPVGFLFVESDPDTYTSGIRRSAKGFDYQQYWEETYAGGGNSGAGSYGVLAEYKAAVLNELIEREGIRTVLEFGCGDGHQLGLVRYPEYIGLDVSGAAVDMCLAKYSSDETKSFFLYHPRRFRDPARLLRSELVVCLDVLYHITDEADFKSTLDQIFSSAERYVVLYTKITGDDETQVVPTIKDRDVLLRIRLDYSDFKIVSQPPQPYPHLSSASFIVLERVRPTKEAT